MKKIVKRILSFVLVFITLFSISSLNNILADTLPEDETYLWSTKDGTPKKVYHYNGGEVTLPKNFTVYESEMRGVWVATVYNIAIGKQKGTSDKAIADYKAEFLTILDRMEEYGMNTLFFQIRPSNDAFYKSELNPWSEFLVGADIDPGWDPLKWMIDETHKRGFDFQCWMNAYRVTTESALPENDKVASYYSNEELISFKKEKIAQLADRNFAKIHPEYVLLGESDTRLILNPSEIAVQDFIVESLKEIVENYDIDGMHFDDYFYLNGSVSSDTRNTNFAGGETYDSSLSGENTLNDLGNYQEYLNNDPKYGHMERGYSLGDFRRENVNVMMRKIRAMVDEYNEKNNDNVEFGSKPAAVWRSKSSSCPNGSNTHPGAYSSYSDLFADTWKWVEEGLVDYVAPQVYYAFEDNYVGYADIVDWWSEMVENLNIERAKTNLKPIKLYIAHGIYKYRDNKDQFYNASEIRNQIVYNKKHSTIVGSAFYSYECLYQFATDTHEKGATYLKNNWSKNPVYPIQRGEDDSAGLKVENYNIINDVLAGTHTVIFPKQAGSRVYGIYKVAKGATFNPEDLSTRMQVIYDPYVEGENATLGITDYDANYDYYVKVVSTNGYVSKESTKLDFSNVTEVESMKINSLSNIPVQVLAGSSVSLTANISNQTGNKLSYNLYYVQNGNVREDRILSSGVIDSEKIDITFKSYTFAASNAAVCLEITDGKVKTRLISNKFDIVDVITIPQITSVNNLFEEYSKNNPLEIIVNMSTTSSSYVFNAYLVNKDTLEEESIYSSGESSAAHQIYYSFENVNYENAKLKFEIIYQDNSYITEYDLKIVEQVITKDNVILSDTIAKYYNKFNVTVSIPSSITNIPYSIQLIDESGNIINTLKSGTTSENIFVEWDVKEPLNNFRVKVTLGENGTIITIISDEIKAYYESNITLDPNGGILEQTSINYLEGVGCELPTPTKEGYIFLGWYILDKKFENISPEEIGNKILTAKWQKEKVKHTITYNLDGGVNESNAPTEYVEGEGVSSLPKPTKEGYIFKGWYKGEEKVNSISITDNTDITLNAKWEKIVEEKPTEPSDNNDVEKGCNCGCGKSASIMIMLSALLACTVIIFRKRK